MLPWLQLYVVLFIVPGSASVGPEFFGKFTDVEKHPKNKDLGSGIQQHSTISSTKGSSIIDGKSSKGMEKQSTAERATAESDSSTTTHVIPVKIGTACTAWPAIEPKCDSKD
jgi:hypothetical protein